MGALSRLQAEMQANEEAIHRAEQNKLLLENTLQNAEIALNATTQSLVQYQQPRPAQSNRSEVPLEPVKPETRHRPSDDIRARLDAARLRYFDDYPEVKNLKRELDLALATEARADAAEAQRAARTPLPTRTAPKETPAVETPAISAATIETLNRERERIATTKTQIELLDTEITTRNADRGRIEKSIASYQARVEKLPLREQQMSALTRDYETSKANYRSLLEKKSQAEMASQMEREEQSERFTIADPAHEPTNPVKPHRWLLSLAAALGALILSLGIALAFELRKDVILGEWELPTGVPVLGRVACMDAPRPTEVGSRVPLAGPAVGMILFALGCASAIVGGWPGRGV